MFKINLRYLQTMKDRGGRVRRLAVSLDSVCSWKVKADIGHWRTIMTIIEALS